MDRIKTIAAKLRRGNGCCGSRPEVTPSDLEYLGLWPLPEFYDSALGRIVPSSGPKALAVYMYQKLSGTAWPVGTQEEPGVLVARVLELRSTLML